MNSEFAVLAEALASPPAWLQPHAERASEVLDAAATKSIAEALNAALPPCGIRLTAGLLRFVPQSDLPIGEGYEAHIARTACVPTRDNLHDLLNGLVWLSHPELKRRLNALQCEAMSHSAAANGTRGPARDALTLFDENGAFWQAPPVLTEALRHRDWHALFITHRVAWRDAQLVVFGHALMEKLLRPRKAITAHVLAWPLPGNIQELTAADFAAKPFLPLPLLGIPGWWPPNEEPGFYDDATVFRPPRDNRAREASQTAAGAISERRHWRKVRTAQGGVAANGCPP